MEAAQKRQCKRMALSPTDSRPVRRRRGHVPSSQEQAACLCQDIETQTQRTL